MCLKTALLTSDTISFTTKKVINIQLKCSNNIPSLAEKTLLIEQDHVNSMLFVFII